MDDALRTLSKGIDDVDLVTSVITNYDSKLAGENKEYTAKRSGILYNSKFKIVIYLKQGAGFSEVAERVRLKLMARGYRVDIWLATGQTDFDARSDIASEFPGAAPTIKSARTGVVVAPSAATQGEEVRKVLDAFPLFQGIQSIEQNLKPASIHLKKAQQREYDPDKVILVFVIAEPEIE